MNVYEAVERRRSIRDFAPKAVGEEALERILAAGVKAPSHDHMRDWHFVLVGDPELRQRIVRLFHRVRVGEDVLALLDSWGMTDPTQRAAYIDAIPKQVSMVLEAGALIIPCFRQEPGSLLKEKKSLHELNALASIWAVLENTLLAAASEGILGVTKIVSTPKEMDGVRAILGIPDDYEAPCYLCLGYPRTDTVWNEQVRMDVRERIHVNAWARS